MCVSLYHSLHSTESRDTCSFRQKTECFRTAGKYMYIIHTIFIEEWFLSIVVYGVLILWDTLLHDSSSWHFVIWVSYMYIHVYWSRQLLWNLALWRFKYHHHHLSMAHSKTHTHTHTHRFLSWLPWDSLEVKPSKHWLPWTTTWRQRFNC